MSDPATLSFYEQSAERYARSDFEVPQLGPFLDRLHPGARILELGCGAGRDAAQMIARGFRVDATDAAAAMVAVARDKRGVAARQMRFDELNASAAYDAAWASACLIHVARADFAGVLARIARALRPGGWHFASFKLGDGEGRDALGRLHNFPERDWLVRAYEAAGFTIEDAETYRGKGADGVLREWCALTARLPAERHNADLPGT